MKGLVSFAVGLLFALGLGLSGMTQTHVVKGFLDVFGNWNMNLIGVMVAAIAIHAIAYRLVKQMSSPLLDTEFHLPPRKNIDKRLFVGAAFFGLGWGWAGICPGPGVVSLVSGDAHILAFVLAMIAGMSLFKLVEKHFGRFIP